MKLDDLLGWSVNVFAVAVLPARIGVLGGPLWFFLVYAVIAGIMITLAEDVRYVRSTFVLSDLRDSLKVRTVIVMVYGIAPFLLGRAFAW